MFSAGGIDSASLRSSLQPVHATIKKLVHPFGAATADIGQLDWLFHRLIRFLQFSDLFVQTAQLSVTEE